MKLSAKLSLMSGFLLLLTVLLGTFSLQQMSKLNSGTAEIDQNWLPSIKLVLTVSGQAAALRLVEAQYIEAKTADDIALYQRRKQEISAEIEKILPQYVKLISSPEEQHSYDVFLSAWKDSKNIAEEIATLARNDKEPEARALFNTKSRQLYYQIRDSLAELVRINTKGSEVASKTCSDIYATAKILIIVLLAGALIVGTVTVFVIVRGTHRQLGKDPGELNNIARRVVDGDYNIDDGSTQLGVYKAIVEMVQSLKTHIDHAKEESSKAMVAAEKAQKAQTAAEEASARAERAKKEGLLDAAAQLEGVVSIIASASEELSAQIEQSSHGAELQAGRIADTATAVEEMNATVLEVAKNAGAGANLSSSTQEKAREGEQITAQCQQAMNEVQTDTMALKTNMDALSGHAQAINEIMTVISDIADQTNLLALNAAIEAARAGEAGRGFAVVADEVRKLAEKTMASTLDVGKAIRAIQESSAEGVRCMDMAVGKVNLATELTARGGQALKEILSQAEQTADQVRSIATASEQQSASSEEIARSVDQVNTIASETSRAMGEASKAVSDLAAQAQKLAAIIHELKTV